MRSHWKWVLGAVAVTVMLTASVAVLLGWRPVALVMVLFRRSQPPIRLGLLHSQTGLLAISEKSILDAEILAIEEINASGGVANRLLNWDSPDCRSDPAVFASEARRLVEQEQVAALFGCWTSECRKAVIPVLNETSSLLFFPGNFEGIERSPSIIYTGGVANQSILPAVRWAYDSLTSRRYFVIGLEEVWSRCGCEIAKDAVKATGAELVGEYYTTAMTPNVEAAVAAIVQTKPDVVLNFLCGDANLAFYAAMRRAGMPADKMPMIAFGFGEDESRRFTQANVVDQEDESRRFAPADVVDQYAAWNYFQSVDRPENREFIKRFRVRFGDNRVISDPMIAAYNSVKFWAKAAVEVGPENIKGIITNLGRQSMDAPDGIVTIDGETQIAWRPFHIGRLLSNGQFEIIWSIEKPIRPVMMIGTRNPEQWTAFLESLKVRWKGRWSAGTSSGPIDATATR